MKCLAVFVAVLFLPAYAAAQGAATAEMHVVVKDPKGALVSNATVTVLNPATAFAPDAVPFTRELLCAFFFTVSFNMIGK